MLARGDLAFCIDNIVGTLNNGKLAALLTQDSAFSNRILGKSEDVNFENLSVLFATGVNLQLSSDLPSRCLMIRVEPESERPEAKWFPFHQVDKARELFPSAVMAIKAVLRAHQLQGFPGLKKLKVASRFPVWDQRIRGAIVWIGYADPIGTQDLIRADDPLLEGHRRLLWILRGRFKGDPFLTCELSSKLDSDGLEYLRQITGRQNAMRSTNARQASILPTT